MLYVLIAILWIITFVITYTNILYKKYPFAKEIPFEKKIYNDIYVWSYAIPFKWFVDEDEPTEEKTRELQKHLILAGYTDKFTVRSFMAFKTMVLITMLLMAGLVLLAIEHMHTLIGVITQNPMEPLEVSPANKIMIVLFFLAGSLFPNMIIKGKSRKHTKEYTKDIPVLQMFIILLLRSNKTVQEILFALSKVDTTHKIAFKKGYRMYLRNQTEGMQYLKNYFKRTRFIETISLLEDIGKYPKKEVVRILESNLHSLVEESNQTKRRADLTKLIYSQASLGIPFLALMLLAIFPLLALGLRMFVDAFTNLTI